MIQKLERKFGKYAIRGLMKYIIILYATGFLISLINPQFYYNWLMLDIDKILHGQIWRLVTFIIQPIESNILFMALILYVYYSIGATLEKVWGTFRFNLYYIMGLLFNIVGVVIIYIISKLWLGTGISYPISLDYINLSMLLAFAVTFPDIKFYIMFLIPVKAKWLSILYVIMLFVDIFDAFRYSGSFIGVCTLIAILMAMANTLIYFLMTRRYMSPKQIKRKVDFARSYTSGARAAQTGSAIDPDSGRKVITRHKCAICGRTELDGEELQFRFCSKCNGNYEYCQDHLFTHTHIQ